jgi:hypothetical protein
LEEEILADAGGGLLKGLGHEVDAAHAGEEEDAVAEILALHEEVDGEDDDDADGSDGSEEAHEQLGGGLELSAVGIDDTDGLDWYGGLREGSGRGGGDVAADVFNGGEGSFEGLFGRGVDGGHPVLDVEAVGGEGARYVEKLAGDDVSAAEDDEEGKDADGRDGEDARDAAGFEAGDGWSEQKGQGEREGEGYEELACEVEDENDDREDDQGLNSGDLGCSNAGHGSCKTSVG